MPRPRRCGGTFTLAADVREKSVLPLTVIVPESGCSRPATDRSVVVLPQPEGPSRVKNWPSSTSKLTSSTAITGPASSPFLLPSKDLTRFSIVSIRPPLTC